MSAHHEALLCAFLQSQVNGSRRVAISSSSDEGAIHVNRMQIILSSSWISPSTDLSDLVDRVQELIEDFDSREERERRLRAERAERHLLNALAEARKRIPNRLTAILTTALTEMREEGEEK